MTDDSITCAVVIFRVKVSCITSVDGSIKLWLLTRYGQVRRDVIGRLSVKPWCYWLWRPRNSPIQDYVHPDGHAQPTHVQTQSAPTARTLSTLHTVKNVLWPYRPYDCTDSATVTDLQTVCAKATGSFHPTYQRAALERQCITEISVISFSLFQNLQVRCFVFSFSVCIFLALFLSYLYEYSYQRNWINKRYFIFQYWKRGSFDSSVGRAEDCRVNEVILRSLVRIRLEGMNFSPFSRAVEYIVPALRSSYWFREISDFVFLL